MNSTPTDREFEEGMQELVDNGEMEVFTENGRKFCRLTEKGLAAAVELIKEMSMGPVRGDS